MVDTVRTVDELVNIIFATNQLPHSITEQDVRDAIVSISLETTDLSSLPRSPANLPVGRLWIDSSNALRIVTTFIPTTIVDFMALPGNASIFANPQIAGHATYPGSAQFNGIGALAVGATRLLQVAGFRGAGAGGLSATPVQGMVASALFLGAGGISGSAVQRMRATRTIGGAGSFSAAAQVQSNTHWGTTSTYNSVNASTLNITKTGNDGQYTGTVASVVKSSGKWYWEIQVGTKNGDTGIGIANSSYQVDGGDPTYGSYLGYGTSSYGVYNIDGVHGNDTYNNVGVSDQLPPIVANARYRIALDCANWKWWISKDGGAWNLDMSGTQDPASGAGGLTIQSALQSGGVGPAICLATSNDDVTGCFASSSWSYTAPSGFSGL